MSRRRICITTGSRAEYGHMQWLARDIADDTELELQFMVLGMHMAPQYGMTVREIEADGFFVNEKVETALASDSPVSIAKSMGLAVSGCAEALARLRPDVLVILGDRYEMVSAALAALVLRIPIAHIHGGETTEGAFDEALRHSITKMAHLHFTAAEPYRRRVIQLGEAPERVFNFGGPGLDTLLRQKLMTIQELSASTGFDLDGGPLLLVTYHPVTLAGGDPAGGIGALVDALERFPDTRILITGVNADTGNSRITTAFQALRLRHPARVFMIDSLGHHRYISAMSHAAAMVGNSSSGIGEAPALGLPTVNIGDRQKGRLRAESIIDCAEDADAIATALTQALSPDFRQTARSCEAPYGRGGASSRIKDVLKTASLDGILMKSFHDLAPEVIR
ncbi:UDP-N-acetylglucosamine 2-epimerase [Magnetospirillum sp. 64-120]|uniref:UDP-N-acetylglucosamine 2-epimerase n=1 Tax=Magnetospirillum sp. 64-120 TaxID=1895778 RepID=UPI00092606D8|nr:UDP-N-acetylglucosamine 2-epimerase [Magnetospirillum sp. 64-120]OJX68178.1 MAG: UDP-N-acetyl-D-glucosamine 2-epimerase, UDP-hydrolysing [Magnetospirillum sp. 64-120]